MTNFQKLLEKEPKLEIDGVLCLSVAQFSRFSGLSIRTINDLILKGNRRGRLPAKRQIGKRWIPLTELFSYNFIEGGRYGHAFVIDEEGHRQYVI